MSEGLPSPDHDKRLKELKDEYAPTTKQNPVSEYASAGVELGLVVVVFTLLGWWADKKLNTSPWLLLLGCAMAIFGGMYRLIKLASRPGK